MTTIKGHDGAQYVLVLTKEEAEILGTFRFHHVGGLSPLYRILKGLPVSEGRFVTETRPSGTPVFSEFVPNAFAPLRRQAAPSDTFASAYGLVGSPTGRLIRTPLPPLHELVGKRVNMTVRDEDVIEPLPKALFDKVCAVAKRKWIVQYNVAFQRERPNWERLTGSTTRRATGEYESRNEAYRQMRARAKWAGVSLSDYRVVPSETPNGPEKDRGYYIVQYVRLSGEWADTFFGPGHGNNCGPGDRYATAEAAQRDIKDFGTKKDTYRVKWYPYNK